MNTNFNLNQFIKDNITFRNESLFLPDIKNHEAILHEKIGGKRVMVIGGAGTIGSSYIRAILHFKPEALFVVDTNENGLTELTRDLRSREGQYIPETYLPYPINFGSKVFYKLLDREGPFDIIANFAAHKHVRSEKDHYSIESMIENNVFKAAKFLEYLSDGNQPEHFFCVSTDKAANPVNVMGASKKLMEEVIMAYSEQVSITTARFANVAFSNGSLLDGYFNRLMKNQPLSCPSDVRRFFVSPEESGQICMLACMLGTSGDIFFPKLEEDQMVNFKDITERFMHELGYQIEYSKTEDEARSFSFGKSNSKYPVLFFPTNTSGEKLYEEFYTKSDKLDRNTYNSLAVIKNATKKSIASVNESLELLKDILRKEEYTKADIVTALTKHLPNFQHIETGKSLDQQM